MAKAWLEAVLVEILCDEMEDLDQLHSAGGLPEGCFILFHACCN